MKKLKQLKKFIKRLLHNDDYHKVIEIIVRTTNFYIKVLMLADQLNEYDESEARTIRLTTIDNVVGMFDILLPGKGEEVLRALTDGTQDGPNIMVSNGKDKVIAAEGETIINAPDAMKNIREHSDEFLLDLACISANGYKITQKIMDRSFQMRKEQNKIMTGAYKLAVLVDHEKGDARLIESMDSLVPAHKKENI